MADALIQVENASKKYCRSLKRSLWYGLRDMVSETVGASGSHDQLRRDEFWAVQDVSFELRRGECLGLIGHNGAGKTTLLKMLNGLIKPDRGRITMRGRVGALIALGAGFNPILTGRENIYVNGSVLGLTQKEMETKVDGIIDFANIREFIDAPVRTYSSGMQVRLGFAVAVAFQPNILLLDEVLAVGDIAFQAKCFNTLSAFRAGGTAFILVSHNMHHIQRYCDRVLYLSRGRVRLLGNAQEAVDAYNREMTASATRDAEATDFDTTYGSGRVRITAARFLDADGRIARRVRSGEPVTLCLEYHCPNPPVSNAILDMVIRDREGVLFQGTNLDFSGPFPEFQQSGTVKVAFDSIPANGAELDFFVALLDADTREVFDWKRYLRLEIVGNPRSVGRVLLSGRSTLS